MRFFGLFYFQKMLIITTSMVYFNIKTSLVSSVVLCIFLLVGIKPGHVSAAACTPMPERFGIPTWYKYLPGETAEGKISNTSTKSFCKPILYTTTADEIKNNATDGKAGMSLSRNITAIGLAFTEIIFRILIYLAIAWGIWGGYQIIISGGDAQGFKSGIDRVRNAAIGLLIGILATPIVSFVASKIVK